jgi:hypothetical protein
MNAIRCPQCSLVNPTSALQCQQCQFPFSHLPQTAYVSVPASDYERAAGAPVFAPAISPDNDLGRKTFLWYRVYLSVMCLIYLALCGFGIFLGVYGSELQTKDAKDLDIIGPIYAVIGAVLFVPFLAALFFPRKSWNWVVGIIMMAFGMTSCCFWPFLIPLIIFWVKPETQAYLGRVK